ncbi:MAG: hypothetical protein AB4080_14850 [Trichodesmium sp.]
MGSVGSLGSLGSLGRCRIGGWWEYFLQIYRALPNSHRQFHSSKINISGIDT